MPNLGGRRFKDLQPLFSDRLCQESKLSKLIDSCFSPEKVDARGQELRQLNRDFRRRSAAALAVREFVDC